MIVPTRLTDRDPDENSVKGGRRFN